MSTMYPFIRVITYFISLCCVKDYLISVYVEGLITITIYVLIFILFSTTSSNQLMFYFLILVLRFSQCTNSLQHICILVSQAFMKYFTTSSYSSQYLLITHNVLLQSFTYVYLCCFSQS